MLVRPPYFAASVCDQLSCRCRVGDVLLGLGVSY